MDEHQMLSDRTSQVRKAQGRISKHFKDSIGAADFRWQRSRAVYTRGASAYAFQPLTDQQKQQVREELQRKMTAEQMEKFKQLWKENPELRQRSTEMWKKLGFDSPPVPEELLDSEDEESR